MKFNLINTTITNNNYNKLWRLDLKNIKIKSFVLFILIGITSTLLTSCFQEKKAKVVLAKVGNTSITKSQVENRYNAMPKEYKSKETMKENQKIILEQLTLINKQVAKLKKETLINLLLRDNLTVSPVSDEEIKTSYTTNQQFFEQHELRRASHILTPTRKEALKIQKKILNGQNFKTTAQKLSQDATAKNGGDIGWVRKGQISLPKLDKVIFSLKQKGSTSKIIETELGFHLIKLTDIKIIPKKPLESVKEQIKENITVYKQNQALTDYVEKLKKSHTISITKKKSPKNKTPPINTKN